MENMEKSNDSLKDENRLIVSRINNLNQLIDLGIDPFPKSFKRTHLSKEAISSLIEIEEKSGPDSSIEGISIAGRVIGIRGQGKMVFMDIKDRDGLIQAAMKKDILETQFDLAKLIDLGDIVGLRGKLFRTRRGEPSIEVAELVILTKAMRPMPDKWSGLKDVEKRYRQ